MKKSTPFNYKIIENSIFIHDLKLKTKIGINKNELNLFTKGEDKSGVVLHYS